MRRVQSETENKGYRVPVACVFDRNSGSHFATGIHPIFMTTPTDAFWRGISTSAALPINLSHKEEGPMIDY